MGILVGVLVMCMHYEREVTECDVRVKDRVVNMTTAECKAELQAQGEKVRRAEEADPDAHFTKLTISAACYTQANGKKVAEMLPKGLDDIHAVYTITHY